VNKRLAKEASHNPITTVKASQAIPAMKLSMHHLATYNNASGKSLIGARARARAIMRLRALSYGLIWAAVMIGASIETDPGQEPAPSSPREAPAYINHTRLMFHLDDQARETPVKSAGDWQVRRGHILSHFLEVAGAMPGKERRVPLAVTVMETHQEPKYLRKKIQFASEPGDIVPAWLLVPKAADGNKKRLPAMLCLHQTIAIGKDEPAGLGKNAELAYARELAERGYVAIVPDYPNFGEYKVDVYQLGYASTTMKAIWNNMRAIDVLLRMDEVDPRRIGVIGHSLGGHNAIFTALFDTRIRAVVSSCGFNAFPFYYGGKIAGWSHKGYMPRLRERYQLDFNRVPFDFPELIGALAPRAFFANAPIHDANFEVDGVRLCFQSARPVYDLLGAGDRLVAAYPDAQHAFPRAVREQAYTFLDRFLSPEQTR
jgi:dienelactone hydrolase